MEAAPPAVAAAANAPEPEAAAQPQPTPPPKSVEDHFAQPPPAKKAKDDQYHTSTSDSDESYADTDGSLYDEDDLQLQRRLVARMQKDMVFELRFITHIRPVSGAEETREAVARVLERRISTSAEEERGMNQADDMDSILSEGELSIDSEVALWHELLGGLSSASELSGSHETLQEALASADGGMARGSDALTDVDTDVDENDDVFDDDEASWSDSEQEAEEAARPAPSVAELAASFHNAVPQDQRALSMAAEVAERRRLERLAELESLRSHNRQQDTAAAALAGVLSARAPAGPASRAPPPIAPRQRRPQAAFLHARRQEVMRTGAEDSDSSDGEGEESERESDQQRELRELRENAHTSQRLQDGRLMRQLQRVFSSPVVGAAAGPSRAAPRPQQSPHAPEESNLPRPARGSPLVPATLAGTSAPAQAQAQAQRQPQRQPQRTGARAQPRSPHRRASSGVSVRPPLPPRVMRLMGEDVHRLGSPREENQDELRRLVANGLVTRILQGNFGAVLEVHIRNRAEAIRRERAQDASTALRARHGLGPHTERPEEGGPYVQAPQPASQAQAQAQAAPPPSFARSRASASASENSASRGSGAPASAALRDMSQAIEGLAEAVRHMYLMQQETQRAIRQEVASAMHMYAQQQQHNGAPRMDETSLAREPVSMNQCVVCLENMANTVMYRCGHLCACLECALDLKSRNMSCPCCRAPVENVIQVYVP